MNEATGAALSAVVQFLCATLSHRVKVGVPVDVHINRRHLEFTTGSLNTCCSVVYMDTGRPGSRWMKHGSRVHSEWVLSTIYFIFEASCVIQGGEKKS